MDVALMRWLGWAAVVLLLLGAVGSFFSRYQLLGTMLDGAQTLLLQDDLYQTMPSDLTLSLPGGIQSQATTSDFSEICSGKRIQSLWLLVETEGLPQAKVQVDGIPLDQLQCEAIPQEAEYLMKSRTGENGLFLEMDFQRIR